MVLEDIFLIMIILNQVLFGNYLRGDKNGLFILIHNEEDEKLKEENKKI